MQPRIYYCIFACAAVIFVGCNAAALNEKQSNLKDNKQSGNYDSVDDLYLDDQDGLDGSGQVGGEVRDDLEASGSGFGPDDEDGDGGRDYPTNTVGGGSGGTDGDGNGGNGAAGKNKVNSTPKTTDSIYVVDPLNKGYPTRIDPPPKRPVDEDDNDSKLPGGGGDIDGNKISEEATNIGVSLDDKRPAMEHASSFFAQPGVLAAVIGGAVVGLLCAILVVMFIVYRMRKKDEGSYALDEPRRSPAAASYPKPGAPHHNREFYA